MSAITGNVDGELARNLLTARRPVRAVVRDARKGAEWEALSLSQGMKNPEPRMVMLDGFNEGWIEFENRDRVLKGKVEIEAVLKTLLERDGK